MPAGNVERFKIGVERFLGALNGHFWRVEEGVTFSANGYKFARFWNWSVPSMKDFAGFAIRSEWDELPR